MPFNISVIIQFIRFFNILDYLCIIANRSSVVRSLLGEGNKLSSSNLQSSVRGEFELSLGVESVKNKYITKHIIFTFPL